MNIASSMITDELDQQATMDLVNKQRGDTRLARARIPREPYKILIRYRRRVAETIVIEKPNAVGRRRWWCYSKMVVGSQGDVTVKSQFRCDRHLRHLATGPKTPISSPPLYPASITLNCRIAFLMESYSYVEPTNSNLVRLHPFSW